MRYPIVDWNVFLATRERGRRVREDIEHKLAGIPAGATLTMDFSGVEGITVSFGDECVAKLILARATGDYVDRGLVIEGANEDVRETLETILARRKVAAVSVAPSGELEVLGEQRWLPETLSAALELRSFRATDLAAHLGLTPQAANNRLRVLVASGAVARELVVPEGGGKEFSYRIAVPAYA
jgi:STAS-like domain of unknown function (DUF4325)